MMRSIVRSSLQYRFLVIVVAGGIMLAGVNQLRAMPVDVLPEFAPPYVEIQTEALGLSADEVEQLITVPLEQDLLNGVPWLDTIRSDSVSGLSSIVLIFEPGTNLYRARQMVAERMTQAFALPHVSKPPTMIQPLSSASRFMIVGLSSKDLSLIEMSVLARWTIAPRLVGVPGVANVAIWGNRDRQLQVQVDPKLLQDHNISLLQVLESTGNALWVSSLSFVEASTPGTGGFIDTAQQRLGIRHISPIVTSDTLAQVPIENSGVRLGDVANVVEDHQPLIGDALTNNGPSLLLVIQKFPGANTLEVTRGVESALAELSPGLSGMETDTTIYRPADFIEAAIDNVGIAMLIGFFFIALVLIAFFFDWRKVLAGLVVIPLSLVAAGFVLALRGATFNSMILVGLIVALGTIIDDAIIDVENMARRLNQHRQEGGTRLAVNVILEASLEMRSAALYAVLVVLLAAVPIYFIEGASSAFFQPLAVTYALAVLLSMLVALTVTPALGLILMANDRAERRASPLVVWLQRVYESTLTRTIRRGRVLSIAVLLLTIAGLAILPSLNQSLLPSFREGNILIHLGGAPGASQPEMSRIAGRVSAELRDIPGIRNVAAQVGRAVFGDQVVNVNSAELWVSLDPEANYDETVAAIQKVVDGYPGLNHSVRTYLNEESSQVAAEPNDSIVVRVYGDTDQALRGAAEDVKKAIDGIDGIINSHINVPVHEPTLEIEVNLTAAQEYGIKPGDVRRAAATMFSGLQVGSLFEEQKVFDVVVWSIPETRQSLSSVRDLLIDTPSGERVRLGDVADVRIASSPSTIQHEAVKRYLDIIVGVEGRNLGAVTADIKGRLQHVQYPREYHAEVLGGYAEQQSAMGRLFIFAVAATLGIFLLLQAAFRSWRLALVALLSLPMALTGGVVTAFLGGGILTLSSLVGFLTVLGVALRNSIVLCNHYHQLEQREGRAFDQGLVLHGARERLAPVLMTALATGLALTPTLFLGDLAGFEIIRPMAIVILGGLVTTTWFNLFVVPAFYLLYGASREADLGLLPGGAVELPAIAAD
jgi:CzcA family heavy metal efflux pump